MEQLSQRRDSRSATGRALVDWRLVTGDCLRIRAAAVVSTARALRLWQKRVDFVRECHFNRIESRVNRIESCGGSPRAPAARDHGSATGTIAPGHDPARLN
jgi:hypothetical protein